MLTLQKLKNRQRRIKFFKIILPFVLFFSVGGLYSFYSADVPATYSAQEKAKEDLLTKETVEEKSVYHSELESPTYNGIDTQGRPYELKAKESKEDDKGHVYFTEPFFKITLPHGVWVSLQAQKATLTKETGKLDLLGDVHLKHSSGYDFYTSEATILLQELRAFNHSDVTGTGPMGKLYAKSFELFESGRKLKLKSQTLELNAS